LNFCKDPFCCFGASDLLVALMIMALIWMMLPLVLPLVGFALEAFGLYSGLEAIWGRDFISGEELPLWERTLALLPFGGTFLRGIEKLIPQLRSIERFGGEAFKVNKAGRIESGAIRGRLPEQQYEIPLAPRDWPNISFDHAKNFTSLDPIELQEGERLYRIVGPGNRADGSYWILEKDLPKTEAEWRSRFAVGNWNSDREMVEYTVGSQGLKVWGGPAAAMEASANGYILEGGGYQIWTPLGSLQPFPRIPTNW
jgi:putative toxin of predicted polymorphic toxin system